MSPTMMNDPDDLHRLLYANKIVIEAYEGLDPVIKFLHPAKKEMILGTVSMVQNHPDLIRVNHRFGYSIVPISYIHQ